MEKMDQTGQDGIECLKVVHRNRNYYIPLCYMERILMEPVVVPVPEADEGIMGISMLDGQMIPYLMLESREPLSVDESIACGVILKTDTDGRFGIGVDEIKEVCRLSLEEIEGQISDMTQRLWKEL
ncbi:MAG: chemotaxis protein CheW [Blautia sp.]|jgi:chemotaxis signal transduction protein